MTTTEAQPFTHPMFAWERGDDGVVVITMDDPDQPVNSINTRFRAELPVLVERLHAVREEITGAIITSAKDVFSVQGDLDELARATPADAPRMTEVLDSFHRATRGLETLGRPVVAAINGSALGGGLELALACSYRIALDAPAVRVGLPEVTFGLLPGGGGVARTVRLLGIDRGLREVLLTGRVFPVAAAMDLGLVDARVGDLAELIPAARRWVLEHFDYRQPWDRAGYRIPGGGPADPSVAVQLPLLPAMLRQQARGPLLPAVRNLAAAAVEGAQVDLDTALRIERVYAVELICGQISTNLIKSRFFDMNAVRSVTGGLDGDAPYRAAKAVIVGAGMMGSGIAGACAVAGIEVVLKDVAVEVAERGKQQVAKTLEQKVRAGTMAEEERDAVLARIHPTVRAEDAAGADLVIEAVFEDPKLKQQVIAEVAPYLAPEALIASNTSTLPITELAEGVAAPDTFIGTHFFSPVDRMALIEVVVGKKTSATTIARTLDVAKQIGKIPILVNDSRGFFTSRVISKFLDEALAMVGEGVPAASVEQAAAQIGYPIGPLALVDEVSLTLNRRIREETINALRTNGAEPEVHPAGAVVDRMIDDFDREGRSAGNGFYEYAEGQRTGLWPGLADAFPPARIRTPLVELQERMLFAEAVDAARCLDEGVLRSVLDGNVGSLLGIGFPAWTGGVLQYINQYQDGPAGFVARATELAERYGPHFAPPASLVDLAATRGELV